MYKIPESRLSASNSAVISSESFIIPLTLGSRSKVPKSAFEELRLAFEKVEGFPVALESIAPGSSLIDFKEPVSPRFSRVELELHGKEYRFDLTFALRCPIAKELDFWQRVEFVSEVYDRLTDLSLGFADRKEIDFFIDKARLDQQKEEPERMRIYGK